MKRQLQNTFYSNGNLIITGEYFVLAGARALAVPLKFGQLIDVISTEDNKNIIQWQANELGQHWFRAEFSCDDLEIISSSETGTAQYLQKLLKSIRKINNDFFLQKGLSFNVTCEIGFNLNWGWGSSASLIANLAGYAGIDPFRLHKMVSSGSGYDIAASLSETPVFYQLHGEKHEINPAPFNPLFKNNIRFIYLGRKQSSSAGIEKNIRSVKENMSLVAQVTSLGEIIASTKNIEEFTGCITEHERIVSKTLNIRRIKEEYFNDFEGEIKSLGAWGGDCAMIVSELNDSSVRRYFEEKGLKTIFGFDEIIKT
jgi:mevalonate kinase